MSDVKPVAKNTFTIEEMQVELDAAHFAQEHCRSLWGASRGHSDWRKTHDGFIAGYKAKNAALQAEIEAMRKDAERYKWLRSRMPGAAYRVEGIIYSQGGSGVDAGIDAAIAKEKQQESLK